MTIIRLATTADAAALLAIYAPYIEHTSITFETETPAVEAFAERIQSYLQHFPWLVCEVDGRVAGYAYAYRYRERIAYQWSVECSVYIHEDFMRGGVAAALYTALFAILKKQEYRNVYAVINLPNDRSVALHEKLGFRYFATYEQVGYKHGQWKNVGWWRLIINEFVEEPPAPIPFPGLNKDFLPALLKEMAARVRC